MRSVPETFGHHRAPLTHDGQQRRPAGLPCSTPVVPDAVIKRKLSRGGRCLCTADKRQNGQLWFTSLNIQSLLPEILPLQHEVSSTGADIIVLSETWLKPRVPSRLVTFPGYQLIRADRADGRGFGGAAILACECFRFKALPMPEPDNTTTKLEIGWARVAVGRDRGAAYRPQSLVGAKLTADLGQLESELQAVAREH